jgi:hypothetical protein
MKLGNSDLDIVPRCAQSFLRSGQDAMIKYNSIVFV